MEILKNIEKVRKNKKVKQTVIAEMLGVKQNTYSQYVTRSEDIPFGRLSQIADKLGVRVIDIITYPDEYVLKNAVCEECRKKDEIIEHLNDYIKTLKKKK
ncbi:MAG: helix-turn-helix domain-containing protein [Bacteroidetes bacterium]|nr:helix-turn-helix domain-containing protein [Bacteroidota bacterium]